MNLILNGHKFRYEIENICRLFLPQEPVAVLWDAPEETAPGGLTAYTGLSRGEAVTTIRCVLTLEDFRQEREWTVDNAEPEYRDECELRMAEKLYELFCALFGFTLQWGIITGVRPVKLLRRLIREQGGEQALRWFRERLLVGEDKTALCRRTLEAEDKILALSRPDSFSLYVSVPFCPTRCDYCSFVSQTVERAARLIPAYVERLTEEIAYTGALAKSLGLRLETVYFGGGTPTTLSAEQLAAVLRAVEDSFDLSALREYTVEAGRPDTVAEDKLRTLKAAGVSRVSINPQTLRDDVLRASIRWSSFTTPSRSRGAAGSTTSTPT